MLAEPSRLSDSVTSLTQNAEPTEFGSNLSLVANETLASQLLLPGSAPGQGQNEIHALTENENLVNHESLLEQQEAKYRIKEEARKEKIRMQLLDKSKASHSYYNNSTKEYLILQYVENFNRQYIQVYPGRKDLGLIRPNEFGVSKFVSSTIRPTQLPFKQLYDFRSCANCVADFINYNPLEPPHEFPKVIPSPTYTVSMQSGNSFDMSILLVSLLTGVGYDAYVVSGYASKGVTLMDQTFKNSSELIEYVPSAFSKEIQATKDTDVSKTSTLKYKVKPPKVLKSQFLLKQAERLKNLQLQQDRKQKEDNIVSKPEPDDGLKGLRIHAWVLVLPGKREVSEAFFIEPTTGAVLDIEHSGYLGLESVWSSSNFWVNMQICYDGLKGVSFDLADSYKWEFVLLNNNLPKGQRKDINGDGDDEEEEKEATTELVDMAPSWVDPIQITLEQFESKCPTGGKEIQYRNGKSEIFAEYNRNDGMVRRITFNEHDQNYANLLLERFLNRKDKLCERVRKDELIHEYFHPGRSHGLREHIMQNFVTTHLNYYSSARPDGLVKRVEEIRKSTFHFEDRDDNIYYRSATYETATRGQMIKMTEKFLFDHNVPSNQNIAKKTYFLKEEKIRLVFHLQPGRIVHSVREYRKPPPDQKGQHLDITLNFIVDTYEKPMKQQEMYHQLLELFKSEQALLQAIKNFDRELSEILKVRQTEEQELGLVVSIYDTLRNDTKIHEETQANNDNSHKSKNGESEENGLKLTEIDHLSPFMINIENPKQLSKEDAIAIKEACLKSLRERLVEKANIIQNRLDETSNSFQQKQLNYSKYADTMTMEETEEYVIFCNDALFKINILEKRLAKHKENSPERYIELDAKLRADPRLTLAYRL